MASILVIQMDEPESFDPAKDSTLALALEAQARQYDIYYYTPSQLAAVEDKIMAMVRPITFLANTEQFFERGEARPMDLEEADIILIRQNPPYNMEYLGCTWLLERLRHPKVFNNPASIRNRPEKIFPLEFPQFVPPSCISADRQQLQAFRKQHGGDVVLKPLYGFGGASIHHITPEDAGFAAKLQEVQGDEKEPVILQPYLPEVMSEEKRIVLINGKIEAAFNRRPLEGEFRTNGALGGTAHETTLTPRQIEIGESVGKICAQEGLLFVGLDVIGDYLIEINTTCPTGIPAVKRLYGVDIAKIFWDAAEAC